MNNKTPADMFDSVILWVIQGETPEAAAEAVIKAEDIHNTELIGYLRALGGASFVSYAAQMIREISGEIQAARRAGGSFLDTILAVDLAAAADLFKPEDIEEIRELGALVPLSTTAEIAEGVQARPAAGDMFLPFAVMYWIASEFVKYEWNTQGGQH